MHQSNVPIANQSGCVQFAALLFGAALIIHHAHKHPQHTHCVSVNSSMLITGQIRKARSKTHLFMTRQTTRLALHVADSPGPIFSNDLNRVRRVRFGRPASVALSVRLSIGALWWIGDPITSTWWWLWLHTHVCVSCDNVQAWITIVGVCIR